MQYGAIISTINREIDRIDPALVPAADSALLLRKVARTRARLQALEVTLAKQSVDRGDAKRSGARDSSSYVGNNTGSSASAGQRKLELAEAMQNHPALDDAFKAGDISEDQASAIAKAADIDPLRVGELVNVAKSSSLLGLNNTIKNIKAEHSKADETNDWEHKRAKRYYRSHVNADGMLQGSFCLMPDESSTLTNRLKPFFQAAYRAARAQGGLIEQDKLGHDAFAALIETSGAERKTRRVDINIAVDYSTWAKAYADEGEMAEIIGFGPAPVSLVKAWAADAYLNIVVKRGLHDMYVASETQELTDKLRAAVFLRDRCCQVPGCESTFRLQIDHIHPRALKGKHRLDNLMLLCPQHHRQKTFYGFRMQGSGPTRKWVAGDMSDVDKARQARRQSSQSPSSASPSDPPTENPLFYADAAS